MTTSQLGIARNQNRVVIATAAPSLLPAIFTRKRDLFNTDHPPLEILIQADALCDNRTATNEISI